MIMILIIFKTVVINYGFNFKLKIIINNYDFKCFKKSNIEVTNYNFGDITSMN